MYDIRVTTTPFADNIDTFDIFYGLIKFHLSDFRYGPYAHNK